MMAKCRPREIDKPLATSEMRFCYLQCETAGVSITEIPEQLDIEGTIDLSCGRWPMNSTSNPGHQCTKNSKEVEATQSEYLKSVL